MKYTYESQKKALRYLIENAPHDMEKFQSLYNVEVEGKSRAEISLHDILFSNVWNAEEKVQLIKLYGHNDEKKYEYRVWTYKTYERDIGYMVGIEGLPLIDECIKEKNFSGVQALLNLENHISVATIARIIEYIDDSSERYKFCELIVNHYKGKESIKAYRGTGNQCYLREIPSLCDRYPEYSEFWNETFCTTVSSMEDICGTNDLELVKLFLPTVKNINPLFMFAVRSKNIEMVKLFIEAGADVNFQDLEFECDNGRRLFKTPLKIAIDNNDLEMVKFLHQNGAHLDFVDKSERMQEFISNLGKEESEKETHQYKDYWDRHDYIIWTKTPLEYAITLGAASIIDQDLINNNSTRKSDSVKKQFKDRMDIVKYLYENGATFGEGQINYTDLICFAIKSDDYDSTKYYFEEALKKDSKLDFAKIISFIHNPGVVQTSSHSSTHYKTFEEGANPWFRLCEEYSKKIDNENYNRNIKLMLEKLFNEFSFNDYQFNKYRDVITDFSKVLPKDMLKDIPAIFGVSFKNLEEVLSLGYDINSVENNKNILMDYIINRHVDIEIINKLISLGANINYQDPQSGNNALSCVIAKLPEYDFGTFIHNFNRETGQLYYPPEEYEKKIKSLVKAIIELSNQEVIMSESVKVNVCWRIKPGYPQIIYNEILEALSKKGFKVDDDYVTKSITFLDESYSREYVTNPWGYLWNLYSNFANKSIETNHEFPKIENAKDFKYGTEQSNNLFALISEHLKRNFATSIEEIQEPDKIVNERYYYNSIEHRYEGRTALQAAQDKLLNEISRYIGNLDYRQIITLIDSSSLIDIESIIRNKLLPIALDVGDKKLCRQLIKRGATIICYDENGHDVTSKEYSAEQVNIFLSLNEEYNPNKECEDLLAEIGCGDKVLSKKMKPVKKSRNPKETS